MFRYLSTKKKMVMQPNLFSLLCYVANRNILACLNLYSISTKPKLHSQESILINNKLSASLTHQFSFYYRKTFYNNCLKIDPEPLRTRYELTVLTPSGVLLLPQ